MIVNATVQFWSWVRDLAVKAAHGDAGARDRHALTLALLTDLAERSAPPAEGEESATLSRVRQSEDEGVWRISADLDNGVSVRLLCAFPGGNDVLIACPAGDTARIGDIFYRNVAPRTRAVVGAWGSGREGHGSTTTFRTADAAFREAATVPGAMEGIAAARTQMRRADAARVKFLEARARALA